MHDDGLNGDELELWRSFIASSRLIIRALDVGLRVDAGLSHFQFEILIRLAGSDTGSMRMTELTDAMSSTKSALTYQVTQLEALGYVTRQACRSDDRGVLAVLTDSGRAALHQALPAHLGRVRALLLDVLTPEQAINMAEGLGAVARGLGAEVPAPRR